MNFFNDYAAKNSTVWLEPKVDARKNPWNDIFPTENCSSTKGKNFASLQNFEFFPNIFFFSIDTNHTDNKYFFVNFKFKQIHRPIAIFFFLIIVSRLSFNFLPRSNFKKMRYEWNVSKRQTLICDFYGLDTKKLRSLFTAIFPLIQPLNDKSLFANHWHLKLIELLLIESLIKKKKKIFLLFVKLFR